MDTRLDRLTVEHTDSPVGVDVIPRFGFVVTDPSDAPIAPDATRIVVIGPSGPVWDTGKVPDGRTVDVLYEGIPLASLSRYHWSVTVWVAGRTISRSAIFVTGVLAGDWHGAEWIGGPDRGSADEHDMPPAPLLRREFVVSTPIAEAYLVVASGGFARVHLDGDIVDPSILSPGFTDYDVRAQYTVADVTDRMRKGRHAIAVELGRGFYGMRRKNTWDWHVAPWHDEPCVRLLLVARDADGAELIVGSDATWRTHDGPTRSDDMYAGEDYDAGQEQRGHTLTGFDDSRWDRASIARGPRGRLEHQRQPNIGIAESFEPTSVRRLEAGHWIVAFPRMIAGWVQVRVQAVAGTAVEIRMGERLDGAGLVDVSDPHGYYDGRFQTHRLITSDEPLAWHPRFSYQGFQYVEILAPALDVMPEVTAHLVHTDVARTGWFRCSDPLVERLHELAVRTVLNNLHGIPTDTPTFEKNGWTGDGMLGIELMMLNLDAHELLAKWLQDVADSRHGVGAPAVIAPFGGWRMDWSPAPTWHAALILGPWWLHRYTGDERVIEDLWADMEGYLSFELARCPEGIARTTLGDWVSPDTDAGGGNPDEDARVPATAFLHAMLLAMASMAETTGRARDAARWHREAARVRVAFRAEFVSDEANAEGDIAAPVVRGYGESGLRQSHHVLAVALLLLPPRLRQRAVDALAADIVARDGHLDTGALGTKFLLPVLENHGYPNVAVEVLRQSTFPSWGFWVAQGATALWEHWKPESRSRGHFFLGTFDDWLFHGIAGVSPQEPGWGRSARADPSLIAPMVWVDAGIRTPYGVVRARAGRDP
ncbi:family 78 glycoside hydrolase catalytic domain [Microbacterium shaanxiense]